MIDSDGRHRYRRVGRRFAAVERTEAAFAMNWHERLGLDGRLFGPEGNPYLRLSAAERYRLGLKMLLGLVGAVFFLWMLGLVGWRTA